MIEAGIVYQVVQVTKPTKAKGFKNMSVGDKFKLRFVINFGKRSKYGWWNSSNPEALASSPRATKLEVVNLDSGQSWKTPVSTIERIFQENIEFIEA